MAAANEFREQILELIDQNGWSGQLVVEVLGAQVSEQWQRVQVKLSDRHPTAPGDIVNVYTENVHSLEQVQQECLRSLRTGRPGV